MRRSTAGDPRYGERGECRTLDAATADALFFPESGRAGRWVVEQARAVCRPCPVRLECLRWALEHDELGFWGGTTDAERDEIRARLAQRRRPVPA